MTNDEFERRRATISKTIDKILNSHLDAETKLRMVLAQRAKLKELTGVRE